MKWWWWGMWTIYCQFQLHSVKQVLNKAVGHIMDGVFHIVFVLSEACGIPNFRPE